MGRAREGIGYSLSRMIFSKMRTLRKFSFFDAQGVDKVSTPCAAGEFPRRLCFSALSLAGRGVFAYNGKNNRAPTGSAGGHALYFDTHAHYDDEAFDPDREALLEQLHSQGVELILDPGCNLESSRAALALAERFPFVYAAVGFHPEDLDKFSEQGFTEVRELARHPRCVAIGEIGLDYYWDASHKDEQKLLLRRQLELALELDKPVIIHDREAHADCLEAVKAFPALRGVFHCYSGSPEMARDLLALGWYLGFDGPITYKNAKKAPEVAALCPLDRLLLETDSPYLSPVPRRGRRNDSGNLVYVAEKIAQIKGVSAEEIARISAENGRRLFGI